MFPFLIKHPHPINLDSSLDSLNSHYTLTHLPWHEPRTLTSAWAHLNQMTTPFMVLKLISKLLDQHRDAVPSIVVLFL